MNKKDIIQKTADFVKSKFEDTEPSHDWWHIKRVWNNAKYLQKREGGDLFLIELGALLHDVGDWKIYKDDLHAGSRISKEFLESIGIDAKMIDQVCFIVDNISFKGGIGKNKMKGVEGLIVQDADRLDALGAIGIARVFAGAAVYKEVFYDPEIPVPSYKSTDEYIKAVGTTKRTAINHFHEKLLKLKDLMNTKTGKKMAQSRHKYMEDYLKRFAKEWEGKA